MCLYRRVFVLSDLCDLVFSCVVWCTVNHAYRSPSQEYDLEQRIALEIKMREGTTKLLAACGAQGPRANLPHTLEAAKNLLTSNERMTAYMAELQRRRNSSLPHDG